MGEFRRGGEKEYRVIMNFMLKMTVKSSLGESTTTVISDEGRLKEKGKIERQE